MNIFASVGVSVGGRGVTKEGGSYAGGFKLTYLSRGVVLAVDGGGVVLGWCSVLLFFDYFVYGLVLTGLSRGLVGMCAGGVLILVVLFLSLIHI